MTAKAVESNAGRVGEYFNWTLADENGKPMKNVPMKIGFNAVVYTLTVSNKSYKTTVKDKQLTATFQTSRGNPIASKKRGTTHNYF